MRSVWRRIHHQFPSSNTGRNPVNARETGAARWRLPAVKLARLVVLMTALKHARFREMTTDRQVFTTRGLQR